MVKQILKWMRPLSKKGNSNYNLSSCRGCNKKNLISIPKYSKSKFKSSKFLANDFACSSVVNSNVKPSLYRCLDCSLVQIPKDVVNNPINLYKNVIDQTYIDNIEIKYKTFEKVFNSISIYILDKKNNDLDFELLDVGSYYGAFLKILEFNNIKATGIEPSIHAYNYSLNNCSQYIENKSLDEYADEINKTFHLITSWDVIEHVDNVDTYLKNINKLLKNNGLFIFSTIFIDSKFAKTLGKYWPWIIPMHLSYFSKESIKAVLKKNNLKQISESNYVHYAKISYAMQGLSNKMPLIIKLIIKFIGIFFPKKWILPFSFGDMKIIVAKKDLDLK